VKHGGGFSLSLSLSLSLLLILISPNSPSQPSVTLQSRLSSDLGDPHRAFLALLLLLLLL
jgi:hypothetical protein